MRDHFRHFAFSMAAACAATLLAPATFAADASEIPVGAPSTSDKASKAENKNQTPIKAIALEPASGDKTVIVVNETPKRKCVPVQFSLCENHEFPSAERVVGFRWGLPFSGVTETVGFDWSVLYAGSKKIDGLQLGLVNAADEANGVQFGLANKAGDVYDGPGVLCGVQFGLSNRVDGVQSDALQIGLLNDNSKNSGCSTAGAQFSLLNVDGVMEGFRMGAVNTAVETYGMDMGVVNITKNNQTGVQFGLVNYSNDMRGVQFGLVNIIADCSIPFFPFVNWCSTDNMDEPKESYGTGSTVQPIIAVPAPAAAAPSVKPAAAAPEVATDAPAPAATAEK